MSRGEVASSFVQSDVAEIPQHLFPGLGLLIQAHQYAKQLQRDVWDFAVEIDSLRTVALTNSDFRWLLVQGWVEQAEELTDPVDTGRTFRARGHLTFCDRTCFVLTELGADHAEFLCRLSDDAGPPVRWQPPAVGNSLLTVVRADTGTTEKPHWDSDRHQLSFAGLLVKEFKLPSPNQERILMTFEEEGWPPRIDDPLPGNPELEPKRRLHDTLKNLNRSQKQRLLRFMGDGTGEGVRWEPVLHATDGGRKGKKNKRSGGRTRS